MSKQPRMPLAEAKQLLQQMQARILQADTKRMQAGGSPAPDNKKFTAALEEAIIIITDLQHTGSYTGHLEACPSEAISEGQASLFPNAPTRSPQPSMVRQKQPKHPN